MQYAERLPSLPSPRALIAPLVALALGAAVATGAYAVIDNDQVVDQPASQVTVIDAPAPGEGVRGIHDMDQAGIAAARSALELRGSQASPTGSSGSPSTGQPDESALPAHQPRRLPAP